MSKKDEESKDKQELYAQYILTIFRPWSVTKNIKCKEGTT